MSTAKAAAGKAVRMREGRNLMVLGMPHLIKTASDENESATSVWEVIVGPGQGVPPHTHTREDEFFCILEGALTCQMDGMGSPVTLKAGDFLFLPRNRMHGFTNATSKEARMMVTVTPGTGTDRMFADLAVACEKFKQPHELMPEVGRICGSYGILFAPPGK
jgi:quercetin dioxygenase-like cupin family protein